MVRTLNQSGTRIVTDEKILVTGFHNGKRYHRMRKPMFWEQFGNFYRVYVRVGDKVFRGTTYDNNGVIEFDIMKSYRLR
jgi:biotin carboxyl carrier protein